MKTLDFIAINPEDVPAHMKLGKEHYENAKYEEGIKEFGSILNVAPDNIDARIWLRKAQEALDGEKGLLTKKVPNPKIKDLKDHPGSQRYCMYSAKGEVSSRVCSRLYDCKTCEFGQEMVDLQRVKVAAAKEAAA
ncbi:MAG: hypothetical protein WC958_01860 [Dehalococcoidales bacterium]